LLIWGDTDGRMIRSRRNYVLPPHDVMMSAGSKAVTWQVRK